ncbi:MAG TPA: MFS transporter, partial [Thermoleophilaceae bacterium]
MERKWWTLIVVCVAIFMLLLDITVVNVALPVIQRDLGASFSDIQWVIDAYALTLASLLLTAGVLGDLLGRRKVFGFGLVLFCAASLGCGLSGSPLVLQISRALQGIG